MNKNDFEQTFLKNINFSNEQNIFSNKLKNVF